MAAAFPGGSNLIREAFRLKNISENSLETMIASLSKNSINQYSSTYKKLWTYCKGNLSDILQPTTKSILEFLQTEFENVANYSTLNSHRSAINLLSETGKYSAVDRFMRGVFKSRPNFPRYEQTWDPQPVLTYLENLYPLNSLNLEKLSVKLVLLLALGSAQRVQTFCNIRVSNIVVHNEGIEIIFSDILKTSGPKRPQPIMRFPFFTNKPSLCIASTLVHYINRTQPLRKDSDDFLILTIKKPHHPPSSQTLSRWIKRGLANGGIDTLKFKAHSTRHAASSAALRAGITIDTIKASAGWTERSQTFFKFYNKPLGAREFFAGYINKSD